MSTLTRLQDKYETLVGKREARIAELEEALRPFTTMAHDDHWCVEKCHTCANLARARKVLGHD